MPSEGAASSSTTTDAISMENLHNPFNTKPVTLSEVENELLSKGVFDEWCERLFTQFDTSVRFDDDGKFNHDDDTIPTRI